MLMSHYHRRLKGIHDPKMTTAKYRRELELGQTKTEHFLVEKWKFIPKKGYGDTREWLPLALKVQSYFLHSFQSAEFYQDSDTGTEVQGQFGLRQLVFRRCSAGHMSTNYEPDRALACPHLDIRLIQALQLQAPDRERVLITPSQLLDHWIPRIDGYPGSENFVHRSKVTCSMDGCQSEAQVSKIQLLWPKTLTLSMAGMDLGERWKSPDPAHPTFPPSFPSLFEIPQSEGPENVAPVTYELVGCSFYSESARHYTGQFVIDDKVYDYDDMVSFTESTKKKKKSSNSTGPSMLRLAKGLDRMEDSKQNAAFYVYHRVSAENSVRLC